MFFLPIGNGGVKGSESCKVIIQVFFLQTQFEFQVGYSSN